MLHTVSNLCFYYKFGYLFVIEQMKYLGVSLWLNMNYLNKSYINSFIDMELYWHGNGGPTIVSRIKLALVKWHWSDLLTEMTAPDSII